MSFPAVAFPDVEVPVKDYLKVELAELAEDVTCAVGLPSTWTPQSHPHIEVACDGVPIVLRQAAAFATVRLTAWARTTSEAKRLAALTQGLLCAMPGNDHVTGARPLTGVLPARDPDTNAEIASTTSRVTLRSAPIEPSGS